MSDCCCILVTWCSTWVVPLSGYHLSTVVVVVVAGGGATRQIAALVVDRGTWRCPRLVGVFLEVLRVADGWNGARMINGVGWIVDTRVCLGV